MDFDKTLYYDIDGQRKRRAEVFSLVTDYMLPLFNAEGRYMPTETLTRSYAKTEDLPAREKAWTALVFLGTGRPDAVKMANTILRLLDSQNQLGGSFVIHGVLRILTSCADKLEPGVKEFLIEASGKQALASKSPDIIYAGINDNFPSMDMMIALIGGKLADKPDAYKKGLFMMGKLKEMLTRRGLLSEYTSPTYSQISLQCMADIFNFTDDPVLAADALACEERILADMLTHYHPATCQMAGPYSRTYMVDCVGHTHKARYLYHALFGDRMAINLNNTILAGQWGAEGELCHHSPHFMMSELGLGASTDYHCPPYLVDIALNKTYPYEIHATTESRVRREIIDTPDRFIYPGGAGSVHTYMTRHYALGTCTKEFSTGVQTNNFSLMYDRRTPAKSQADMATVFTKLTMGEFDPNEEVTFPGGNTSTAENHFLDMGRKFGLQNTNGGIVVYTPRNWAEYGVTSMRLTLFFTAHYGPVEKLWLGGRQCDIAEGVIAESIEACPVYIKDGPVYMGFRPLALTNYGRTVAVRAEKKRNYLMVHFYNYEGNERRFTRDEILLAQNGFLFEVRDEDEIGSISELSSIVESATIQDEIVNIDSLPTGREICVKSAGNEYAVAFCPYTESVRYMTANGFAPPAPVFEATGIDIKKLPFYRPEWERAGAL